MQDILEITLFIEIFMNYLVIKLASVFLREKSQNVFLISLLLGEIGILFPQIFVGLIGKILLIFASSFIIVTFCFKCFSIKDFVRTGIVFIVVTFIFGGGIQAIKNIIGEFLVFLAVVFATGIYIVTYIVTKSVQRKNKIKNFYYQVKVIDNGQEFIDEGFLDSGNMLYDNITKKPVVLVDFNLFHKLYSNISFTSIITKTVDKSSIKNGHYIKINSIGSKTKILAFTIDELIIGNDKKYKDVVVGLSLSGFEKSFGKSVLLHSELI